MLYPRSYHQAYRALRAQQSHSMVYPSTGYVQQPPLAGQSQRIASQQAKEAVTQVRQEERTLWAVLLFFGLWMVAGALLLLSYMFKYLF